MMGLILHFHIGMPNQDKNCSYEMFSYIVMNFYDLEHEILCRERNCQKSSGPSRDFTWLFRT